MKAVKWFVSALLLGTYLMAFSQSQPEIFSTNSGAIHGYDPVGFFNEGKPLKGTDSLTLTWKEATWHFASQQNKDAFQADPEKYAPQYGGYCAFGMSRGYKAKTLIETWSIVDGKLYLNYNLDVKKEWSKTPEVFIEKANKNWVEVKKK